MSQDLKPGDVCEIIAAPCMPEPNRSFVGLQCTIIEAWQPRTLIELLFVDKRVQHFKVELQGGQIAVLCFHCLRKKQPPQQLGSWKEIARLTNWNPVRDGVTA